MPPDSHPAHALLSAAHALLAPANTLATNTTVLPIEEVKLPSDDVSDLKDVFEAINRLCETMKTTTYTEPEPERSELVVRSVEILTVEDWDALSCETDSVVTDSVYKCDGSTFVSAEDISVKDTWESQSLASESVQREERSEPTSPPSSIVRESYPPVLEPSDIYYTASDVSLISDTEVLKDSLDKESNECVMSGHVAAMRERFESMTRANTPCPDVGRSSSPSLDVFRNITPSPDRLG